MQAALVYLTMFTIHLKDVVYFLGTIITYPILRDYFEIAVQMKQSKLLLHGDSNSIFPTVEEWADN